MLLSAGRRQFNTDLILFSGNIHDLLGAASHLQILPVVGACADFLHSQLDMDNCIDVLTLAETYTLLPLQKVANCFVGRYFDKLSWLPQFQRLSPSQLQQLLQQDYPIECAEVDVLKALLRWLLHDPLACQPVSHQQQEKTSSSSQSQSSGLLSPPPSRSENARLILKLINYEHISKEEECQFKECALFTDLQDRFADAAAVVLNEFVKAHGKDHHQLMTQPSGIINVRGFEPALVNVGGFKALRGVSNDLTYYHASNKTWKYLTTIPHVEQCDYGIAVCNNQLYVVGGCFNQSLQEHIHAYGFRYDPSSGDWTAIRPMVHERCRFHLAAVGERLYAVAGIGDELPDPGSCECYDIASNTWYEVAPTPRPVSQQAGAVLQERVVYISGGLDPVEEYPLDQLTCYDPVHGVWEEKTAMLSPRCDHSMVALQHKLYVAGGWHTDSVTLNREIHSTVDCFDLETNQWNSITHMPTPRYHASMVLLADHLYLIGGFTEGQFNRTSNKIECYNVETESWSSTPQSYPFAIWEHLTCVMHIPTCLESRPIEGTNS